MGYVFRVFSFLACVFVRPIAAQVSDSSLVELAGRLLRTQLRGGGWRDTLSWQPTDSASAEFLRQLKLGPTEHLSSIGRSRPDCPGSTDARGATYKQPVGYEVRAFMRRWTADSVMVALSVSCQFTYLGRPNGFLESASWEVVRAAKVWRVNRELSHSIT